MPGVPSTWDQVAGVETPVVILNGTWKFTLTPPENFYSNDVRPEDWADIEVPGECLMQGFRIRHNIGYPFKKEVAIPADFAGQKILLRFDGAYSYARVWVNGHFVRDHHGGFTTWDCEITDLVEPGKTAWLTVEITDRDDEVSYGSGYAHHLIGGILRDISLLALPQEHISYLHVVTELDSEYRDAALEIEAGVNFGKAEKGELRFSLSDRNGGPIRLRPFVLRLTKSNPTGQIRIPVRQPLLWDAEHPNLYTLAASLRVSGRTVHKRAQKVGFREVEIAGNKLLVNGRPVKLRGACRHDVHPLLGRRSTRDFDRLDVRLAREANFNFIRTSHYPPSKAFLDFCDAYGMYVEEETAVCFVGTHRSPDYHPISFSQDDPAFTARYIGQLAEMVERDRNHPSVIVWSIGNENLYGTNFKTEYDWVKAADPTRPVMFSYPGKVPGEIRCYDILSLHYPTYEGDLNQYGIVAKNFASGDVPVIFDEWAHAPCYDTATLIEDPNVRNFWGESLKKFWDKTFESEAVGGAIWGMIDEVFLLPEGPTGYGPWGIVDGWRRKKPEFWQAKKAYSPVRVLQTELPERPPGESLRLPVHNRFDHTNLDELQIVWKGKGRPRQLSAPDVPPHSRGEIIIPTNDWAGGRGLVQFFRGRQFIDEELIAPGRQTPSSQLSDRNMGKLALSESERGWLISGEKFSCLISRQTGLIEEGRSGEKRLLAGGPYIHIRTLQRQPAWNRNAFFETSPESWRMDRIWIGQADSGGNGQGVELRLSGAISGSGAAAAKDRVRVDWRFLIEPDGAVILDFEAADLPEGEPAEFGLSFDLTEPAWVEWRKRGLWSTYPDDHIGRLLGRALLGNSAAVTYRESPKGSWAMDVWDFFLFGVHPPADSSGPLSNDARSLKENILSYAVGFENGPQRLIVESRGDQAARLKAAGDGRMRLIVLTDWNYPDLAWGNYMRVFKLGKYRHGHIQIRLD